MSLNTKDCVKQEIDLGKTYNEIKFDIINNWRKDSVDMALLYLEEFKSKGEFNFKK